MYPQINSFLLTFHNLELSLISERRPVLQENNIKRDADSPSSAVILEAQVKNSTNFQLINNI